MKKIIYLAIIFMYACTKQDLTTINNNTVYTAHDSLKVYKVSPSDWDSVGDSNWIYGQVCYAIGNPQQDIVQFSMQYNSAFYDLPVYLNGNHMMYGEYKFYFFEIYFNSNCRPRDMYIRVKVTY